MYFLGRVVRLGLVASIASSHTIFLSFNNWVVFVICSKPIGFKHLTSALSNGCCQLRNVFSKTSSEIWGNGATSSLNSLQNSITVPFCLIAKNSGHWLPSWTGINHSNILSLSSSQLQNFWRFIAHLYDESASPSKLTIATVSFSLFESWCIWNYLSALNSQASGWSPENICISTFLNFSRCSQCSSSRYAFSSSGSDLASSGDFFFYSITEDDAGSFSSKLPISTVANFLCVSSTM